jgi:signal transduction histidine kinase
VKFTLKGKIKVIIKYLSSNMPSNQSHHTSELNNSQNKCKHCGMLRTTVKDTGTGISQDKMNKLFQLFSIA